MPDPEGDRGSNFSEPAKIDYHRAFKFTKTQKKTIHNFIESGRTDLTDPMRIEVIFATHKPFFIREY